MTLIAWLGRFKESAVILERVRLHRRTMWYLQVSWDAEVGAKEPVRFFFRNRARTLAQLGVELARSVGDAEVAMENVRTDCARAE